MGPTGSGGRWRDHVDMLAPVEETVGGNTPKILESSDHSLSSTRSRGWGPRSGKVSKWA